MKPIAYAILMLASQIAVSATSITVTGYGANREASKQDAFKTAIEKVCGLEVLSDREHYNDKTRYNKVQTYSQCRIVDYTVLEDNTDFIKMHVMVETADRKGFFVTSPTNIFPDNLVDIFDSYQFEKNEGDKLVLAFMRHYPYHAYNLKVAEHNIISDSRRDLFLEIPYQISWNKDFLHSLDRLFNLIQTRTGAGKIYLDRKRYLIDDTIRLDLLKNQIIYDNAMRIRVLALDKDATKLFSVCHAPKYIQNGIFFASGVRDQLKIFTRDNNSGTIYIKLLENDKNIHAIYIDVVAYKDCKL